MQEWKNENTAYTVYHGTINIFLLLKKIKFWSTNVVQDIVISCLDIWLYNCTLVVPNYFLQCPAMSKYDKLAANSCLFTHPGKNWICNNPPVWVHSKYNNIKQNIFWEEQFIQLYLQGRTDHRNLMNLNHV